jgi:hypothetical protein
MKGTIMAMTMSHVSGWDTAGAILLTLWALAMWLSVGVLALAVRGRARPWQFRAGAVVILVGLVGQIGHAQEHFAQVGYWAIHPLAQPWMTPWGTGLANGYGQLDQMKPSLGMEILHLVGNFIFLAGLAGIMVITYHLRKTSSRARKWGKMGVWMQGLHGLEHLSLTLSVALGAKRAIGLSTWLGLMPPGPGLWTYRIWWHFLANVLGTAIFAVALTYLWKERREVEASFDEPAGAPVPTPAPTPAPEPAPV